MRRLTMLAVGLAVELAVVLALTGCGDAAEQEAARRVEPESGAAAQVAKLDEGLRNTVFAKAIRDSGAACPEVTQSQRADIRPGVRGWKAQCDNGSAHLIQISSDGTANVTSRTD